MAAPVMLAFYAAGYFWKRGTPVSALEMDLDVSIITLLPFTLMTDELALSTDRS